MSCDDVDLILAVGAASGGFEPEDLGVVRAHLPGCDSCRRAAAGYAATAELLGLAVEPAEPPERLRTRIMGEVYASVMAGTPAAQAARGGGLRERLARAWRAIPAARGLTVAGATVALAAVALLVWAVGPGRSGATAVVSPVHATLGEPAVQGAFTWYPQTQTAVLSVRGLAAPEGDRVYEVWLVRPSNAPTAAGYLTEQPDGSWSAAIRGSISGYSTVAATVEPRGGSRVPTTAPVLLGSVPSS